MMKRLKYGVFGIVSLLFAISFGHCDYIGGVEYRALSNDPHDLSCSGFCCFMTYQSNSTTRAGMTINVGGETINPFTSSYSTYQLSCFNFSGNFTYYTTYNSMYFWFYDIPISSSSCPDCPTCPTCSENICRMTVTQDGVIDSYYYTGNEGSFTVYLDDDVSYTSGLSYGGSPNITVSPICSFTGGGIDTSGLEWSALYINDIQHIGAGLINLTIPEEFERDYIYTGNGEILDIDVKGYNVDTAYIDGLITTQRTLPNNTDFNNTISGLLPLFVPGIVIIFFLYFIFRFIKKVF